jgi:hypothetical protein
MSGCGVSGYGMSDIAANPLTESLEAARRARLRVQDPRVQMGCRLPERGQALEAQVVEMEPAISDHLVSDPVDLGCQPFRAP